MRILTAVVIGLILNLGLGAGVVNAQYYPRSTWRYSRGATRQAERVVRQAYRDVLGREPDRAGLRQYTDAMVNRGWSEADVRRSLRTSPEARGYFRGGRWADGRAEAMVRRAYLDVLGREPDPEGMRAYSRRVMRDHWSENDVRRALRSSAEYRRRH